ncbi:Topaz1 [Columba guinea]|nr:Topaz1 [Columba guinea]
MKAAPLTRQEDEHKEAVVAATPLLLPAPVMPQLRSGKVVTASEVKSADRTVASPSSQGAEVGHEPGKVLVVKQRPPLAPKRKPGQPLPCCIQPAMPSSDSCEQFVPPVPMQKEQDLEKNLGTQESLCEPKPQEEVDMPERLDGYTLIEARKPGTQEKRKRCLNKKGRTSLKPKLQGPREGVISALAELHIPYQESKKGALRKKDRNMLVSEQLQGVSGQALPTSRRNMHKCCTQEEQQSSDPQKGADGLGESAKEKWKAVEQDSSTQTVKKLKTNRKRSKDSKEKEHPYSKSPTVTTLGKRHLRAALEESPDKSTVKAVGNSAVAGNLPQLDLNTSSTQINKESTQKIMDPNAERLTSLETPESSSVDMDENLRISDENVESPLNMDRSAVTFSHDDVQEVKSTLNLKTKQKDKNKGAVTKRSLSVAVQNGTSTGNKSRTNYSCKASVVNQTFSELKLMKVLNTGNLTKFKIPLCRNKPESRKLESAHSLERETCSPLELLDSTSVPRRQKTGEEILVNSEQQPLPVTSDATCTASMKKEAVEINSEDFKHDSSENLSNEMSALPEHFSLNPHPFLDGQLEPSVPDFRATECVLKSVGHPVALEINDSKSREDLSQHKRQSFPDILDAYEEDVLVIDVIQDDPDLFGANDEEELAVADSENCPLKASCTSISIKDEKRDLKPEYPVISENRDSVDGNFRHITIQEPGMSNGSENSCDWVLKAADIKTHNSSRGSSPLRGATEDFLEDGQLKELDELLKSYSVDEKFKFADGVPDVKQEKKSEAEKSDCKYKDLVNCELLSRLPLHAPKVNVPSEATVMKPRTNGIASHSVQQMLDMIELPRKYCKFYFMTLRGCERGKCWFRHVPEQGDEKICMAILRTYISIKESSLLKRAVQIFVKYYREVTPGVDFASQVLNDLLISLLKSCLLQEVFQILNVTVQINTLPAVDVLLKVFEHVASLNVRDAVPALISTFCKLIDAGMLLELEHFDCIIKFLHQLQVSSQEINIVLNIKSRFQERHFEKKWLFDFNLAVAEIQHCKEKSDWTKLGALYVNARTGCEHFDDLQKLSLCVAEILTRDSETDRPGVPFCDFADAVIKNSQHNEADRIFIGRIGISVMYSYHKVLQWIKGRKVLDKLHELQIHFTVLKGLIGAERLASRCQIVNKAAEIFLKTGSLDGATWVLRESEWTTNGPLWPCDKVDILNRHNLLCTLVHKSLKKSLYRQAFEVLQNLPGFQNHSDTIDVSQYSCLFNKLIKACFESKNLGVSSSAVDFMLSKNIAIDFFLLRGLITALGRSSLWSKARTYYKSALSLGCYPPLQGNLYHKLLMIPAYLSEVEMLLAIEIFLVSNASDIQSPTATSQSLQIILKRCEDQGVQNNSDYQAAAERLILAARLSDPKLFLKHMTMNVNMEKVYSLELASAVKWLQENMKWAAKVWLFQQSLISKDSFGF